MHSLNPHNIQVEHTPGHTSYIRLRFILDGYPTHADVHEYLIYANTWLNDCEEGKFFNKKIKPLAFNVFFKYHTPAIEIDFDIVNETPHLIDTVIDTMTEASAKPYRNARITKAIVGYYNLS